LQDHARGDIYPFASSCQRRYLPICKFLLEEIFTHLQVPAIVLPVQSPQLNSRKHTNAEKYFSGKQNKKENVILFCCKKNSHDNLKS